MRWERTWTERLTDGKSPAHTATEELLELPALVLLGEPGSGKTYEMRGLYEHCAPGTKQWINLGAFRDAAEFRAEMRGSGAWTTWKYKPSGTFHLFLDALDEALTRIDLLWTVLLDELGNAPLGWLHLRLSCRTAVWSYSKLQDLVNLYAPARLDPPKVFEIDPLTDDIIDNAVGETGSTATARWKSQRSKLIELARRPQTFKLLLDALGSGSGEIQRADLYDRAVVASLERVDTQGSFALKSKRSAAEQLALEMMLCAQPHFEISASADERALVLTSGLFSDELVGEGSISGTPKRRRFVHRTYAEHLAAQALSHHSLVELNDLHVLMDGMAPPPLYELVAHTAERNQELLEWLLAHQPDVLTRVDPIALRVDTRARVVEELLAASAKGRLVDGVNKWEDHLGALITPESVPTLRRYVQGQVDGTHRFVARRVAMDAISDAECFELAPELAVVATSTLTAKPDPDAARNIDVRAAGTLRRLWAAREHCEDQIKLRSSLMQLKPLLVLDRERDEHLERRGMALLALWPEPWREEDALISIEELAQAVREPAERGFWGAYDAFITYVLPKSYDQPELVATLLTTLPARDQNDWNEERSWEHRNKLLQSAWDLRAHPQIWEALVHHLVRIGDTWNQEFKDKDDRRRLARDILRAVPQLEASHVRERWQKHASLRLTLPFLIRPEDFGFWTQELPNTSGEELRLLVTAVWNTFDLENDQNISTIRALAMDEGVAGKAIASQFSRILTDEGVANARAERARGTWGHARKPDRPAVAPARERFDQALPEAEANLKVGWWNILLTLTWSDDHPEHGDPFNLPVASQKIWMGLDRDTRLRVENVVKEGLRHPDWDFPPYTDDGKIPIRSLLALAGLQLLAEVDGSENLGLDDACWLRLVDTIVEHANFGDTPLGHRVDARVREVKPLAGWRLVATPAKPTRTNRLLQLWTPELAERVLPQLREGKLGELDQGILMARVSAGDQAAIEIACERLRAAPREVRWGQKEVPPLLEPHENGGEVIGRSPRHLETAPWFDEDAQKLLSAMQAVLNAPAGTIQDPWLLIWPHLEVHDGLVARCASLIGAHFGGGIALSNHPAVDLGRLYRRVRSLFAPDDDSPFSSGVAQPVTSEQDAQRGRKYILNALASVFV